MPDSLIVDIPRVLESRLDTLLASGEVVHVKLKGAFKEALICTDRRAMILKSGFLTGSTFGVNVFQAPYRNISSVDVQFSLLSGVFEILTGGSSGKKKSYWGKSKEGTRAQEEPNCVSLLRENNPDNFREASNFIMAKVHDVDHGRSASLPSAPVSLADELRKLADLRKDGILTDQEFETQKAALMGGTAPQSTAANVAARVDEPENDFSTADAIVQRALAQRAAEFSAPPSMIRQAVFGRRSSPPK